MKRLHKVIAHISFILMLTLPGALKAQAQTHKVADLRIYHLESGSRNTFHQLVEKTIPLVKEYGMNVRAYGPSKVNENEYYLIRTFGSYEAMKKEEEAFYSSDDWINGPREAVLSLIKSYTVLRIPLDSLKHYTVKTITMQELDNAVLSKLNAKFIENFLNEDVEAHEKIIHPDFVCIYGNGTIAGRDEYMKNWATARTESGYTTFSITDEVIRIFGDMALVRSKTVYTKEVNGETVHGNSIYTDTYIKEDGEWLCVQAHITLITAE